MTNEMEHQPKTLLLGGVLMDRYYEVDRYPQAGQDTLIRKAYDRVGGCSINVAVTLNNLGTTPYIVSKVGDDPLGQAIEHYLRSLDMPDTCIERAAGRQTGYTLTMLDPSGERTFFTYKGIEGEYSPGMVPPELHGELAFAYITGYYLLNRQTAAAVLDLAETLRQRGCQTLFDPGPLVGHIDPEQLRRAIAVSDWIVPNAFELSLIQDTLRFSEEPVTWLLGHGCRNVVVKKGSQGAELITPGTSLSVPAFSIQSVDTSGAGDSFAGGLIHGLANGYPAGEAIRLASACGALTATIAGPHGFFTLADIRRFISEHQEKY